jgi:hypothetical protein
MTAAAGYSGTPLVRKLGIKPASRVLLVAAPLGFGIDDVPPDAVVHRRSGRASYDVIVAFCPDFDRLRSRLSSCAPKLTTAGALWLAWPKQASGVSTDINENVVRDEGLRAGLVDVKVAAIDATWASLKFVRRLRDR